MAGISNATTTSLLSEIDQTDKNFAVPEKYFSAITCFLTFNLAAFVGNLLPAILKWVSRILPNTGSLKKVSAWVL